MHMLSSAQRPPSAGPACPAFDQVVGMQNTTSTRSIGRALLPTSRPLAKLSQGFAPLPSTPTSTTQRLSAQKQHSMYSLYGCYSVSLIKAGCACAGLWLFKVTTTERC
jgi:hypothetical protein